MAYLLLILMKLGAVAVALRILGVPVSPQAVLHLLGSVWHLLSYLPVSPLAATVWWLCYKMPAVVPRSERAQCLGVTGNGRPCSRQVTVGWDEDPACHDHALQVRSLRARL